MLSTKHKTRDCNHWANNLPLFDDDKTYELFKRKSRKEVCKNSPSSYASYQVQDINKLYDKGIVNEHEQTNKIKEKNFEKAPPQVMLAIKYKILTSYMI